MASTKAKAVAGGGALALAIGIITLFEGNVPDTYLDPIGIPTVCVGHTGSDVKMGQKKTAQECKALLSADLQVAWEAQARCLVNPEGLEPWTRAAFASFTFNVGVDAFCRSTLVRLANQGRIPEACREILRWTKAAGKELKGLIRRREAEYRLCLGEAF
ncbi:MAG TPA: lysozyme [Edaphobacter sp.]|nr:lysozyme [Edaphobacter sp.]